MPIFTPRERPYHQAISCSIDIGGQEYDTDIIIFPHRVQDHWWRCQGHRLAKEDLNTVFTDKPQMLVIGTGFYGRMQVPEETLATLQAEGIDTRVAKTREAVNEFNRLQMESARVVAALHLTY
jgi:hypothetical protein